MKMVQEIYGNDTRKIKRYFIVLYVVTQKHMELHMEVKEGVFCFNLHGYG